MKELDAIFDITNIDDLPEGLIRPKEHKNRIDCFLALLELVDYPLTNWQITVAYYRKYTREPENAVSCKKITSTLNYLSRIGKIRRIARAVYVHNGYKCIIPDEEQFVVDLKKMDKNRKIKAGKS
jgi:hypothetical protein